LSGSQELCKSQALDPSYLGLATTPNSSALGLKTSTMSLEPRQTQAT